MNLRRFGHRSQAFRLFVVVALMFELVLCVRPLAVVHAAAITVNTTADEYGTGAGCSLREAIQAANSNTAFGGCSTGSGNDVITLPAGTYTLSRTGAGEDANATGDLDITSNITINGAGADTTIMDGNLTDRGLHIHSGATVVINGVQFTRGKTADGATGTYGSASNGGPGGDGEDGGGIFNSGTLTLDACTVSGNASGKGGTGGDSDPGYSAGYGGNGGKGGGIYNGSSTLTLTNSTVAQNATGQGGDGGYGNWDAGNNGYGGWGGDGGYGGGIYNDTGTLTLTDSTVELNTAGQGGTGGDGGWSGGNGHGGDGGYGGDGGGIYNYQGMLALTDVVVSTNSAGGGGSGGNGTYSGGDGGLGGHGGGIYDNNSFEPRLTRCTIQDNDAGDGGQGGQYGGPGRRGGDGGGIHNHWSWDLQLDHCIVSGNTAGDGGSGGATVPGGPDGGLGGDGGVGGGIYNSGSLTLNANAVTDNQSGKGGDGNNGTFGGSGGDGGEGGGIYNDGGTMLTLNNSTVSDNATGNGGNGGVASNGWGGDGGRGGLGGGIYSESINSEGLTLNNSTVSSNDTGNGGNAGASGGSYAARYGGAGGDGGGIYNDDEALLNASTVAGNSVGSGGSGGIPARDGRDGNGGGIHDDFSTTEVKNTIIANNTDPDGDYPDCFGTLESQSYNLLESTIGCSFDVVDPTNITGSDPKLGSLADNGGDTETHALQTGSPAIDQIATGTNGCGSSPLDKDQRSALRAAGTGAGGAACDIGAYEVSDTFEEDVSGTEVYRLHKARIEVTTLGTLTELQVVYHGSNHPNAPGYLQTGQYWTITPTGSGYVVNLTLPHNTTPDAGDQVCRYTGSGTTWDCAADSFDATANTITRDGIGQLSDWATGEDVPTAVTLVSFTAMPAGQAILLQWETATELDNLGFNVYRARPGGGERTKLNGDLIPAQMPGSPVGATYTWLDEGIEAGLTYLYWLEDVDVYGVATLHGPVSAAVPLRLLPSPIRPRPAPRLLR